MASILASLSASTALDLGTGTGRYVPLLVNTGARTVIGLDRSFPMLTRARVAAPLVCADACALPFAADAFDLVVASLMVGDVADLTRWAREVWRALATGGHLIYSDFHPFWSARTWRRTFRTADGRSWSVAYHPHAIVEHRAAVAAAGFDLVEIRQPLLIDDGDAEVEAIRARWGNPPVSVIVHVAKPGSPPAAGRGPGARRAAADAR